MSVVTWSTTGRRYVTLIDSFSLIVPFVFCSIIIYQLLSLLCYLVRSLLFISLFTCFVSPRFISTNHHLSSNSLMLLLSFLSLPLKYRLVGIMQLERDTRKSWMGRKEKCQMLITPI